MDFTYDAAPILPTEPTRKAKPLRRRQPDSWSDCGSWVDRPLAIRLTDDVEPSAADRAAHAMRGEADRD